MSPESTLLAPAAFEVAAVARRKQHWQQEKRSCVAAGALIACCIVVFALSLSGPESDGNGRPRVLGMKASDGARLRDALSRLPSLARWTSEGLASSSSSSSSSSISSSSSSVADSSSSSASSDSSISPTSPSSGVISAQIVAFSPLGFYCGATGQTVTSCKSCVTGCYSPQAALTNSDPTRDIYWNPIAHIPSTDDISITLEMADQHEVKAVLWSNLGDKTHDPLTLKVENAEDAAGPWNEAAMFDMRDLRGTSDVSALSITPFTARYVRLSPGGIEWQSVIRIIGLCSTVDCQAPAGVHNDLDDAITAPLSPAPWRGDACCADCSEAQSAGYGSRNEKDGLRRLLSEQCDCPSCPALPGFFVSYFKTSDDVVSVERAFQVAPFFSGFSLDVDYDEEAFQGVTADFPLDHFSAKWSGLTQVDEEGEYKFYLRSDDGSKLFVNDELVVDNDGLHGMENTMEGTLELQPGLYPVRVDYFEQGGEQGIQVKYSGPDTLDNQVFLRGFHRGVIPANDPSPPDVLHAGFSAQYFKIPGTAKAMPDLLGLTPFHTSIALNIDFETAGFQSITQDFPDDHFAARWTGQIKVTRGGTYTFWTRSDDGSRVIVNDELVTDNDGLHGADEWKDGTLNLEQGYHHIAVDYFELGGEATMQLKYAGPDTAGKSTFLAADHTKGDGSQLCAEGYKLLTGTLPGWGKLEDRGGGEKVQDCTQCATLCSGLAPCMSYECSVTESRCNLYESGAPTHNHYKDYNFCRKDLRMSSSEMVPGWNATFFRLPDYVEDLPDLLGRKADFSSTFLDLDFKTRGDFQAGRNFADFPADHFGARFNGHLQVLIGGT